MDKLLHGRISVNRFTIKFLRKKRGYSQEKLAEECAKMRLPASVASIKRAEAGKNILFRTALSLATLFDVSIDDLVDDVPISLRQYSKRYSRSNAPCIGREWELSQLQSLRKLARSSQKLVCVCGIEGIGKTTLIQQFLHFLEQSDNKVLYTEIQPFSDVISRLCRSILMTQECQDDAIRANLKVITKSSLVYFFLLELMGVKLHKAELCALKSLDSERLIKIETLAITLLVEQLIVRNVDTIAFDDLLCADENQLRFIHTLVQVSSDQPLLIVFGCSGLDPFSSLPLWLGHSHIIPLKPLDDHDCEKLAQLHLADTLFLPSKLAEHKRISIDRSKGHPGILKALLASAEPKNNCPDRLRVSILRRLSTLTMNQCALLKFIACIGIAVQVEHIDDFLATRSIVGVSMMNELVRLGFLTPRANLYVFQHSLIWEIVVSQVEESDREYCKMLINTTAS